MQSLPLLDFGDPRHDVYDGLPSPPDVTAFLDSIPPGSSARTHDINVRMIKNVLTHYREREFWWRRLEGGLLQVHRCRAD